jgi:hypothetical protein
MQNLLTVIKKTNDRRRHLGIETNRWELQLSGGYKSVGLYLVALSGLIARLTRGDVRAVVRYESGKRVSIPMVPWELKQLEQAGVEAAKIDRGRPAAVDRFWQPALLGPDDQPNVLARLMTDWYPNVELGDQDAS